MSPDSDTPDINDDILFEMLKNRRRRYAVYILQQEGVIDLGTLAEQIAALETDNPTGEISSNDRKRIYVSLYQTHLPKLDDVGLIDFNRERGMIEASDFLLEHDLRLRVDRGIETRIFRIIRGLIVASVVIFSYILLNPDIIGLDISAATTMFAMVMPLLIIILLLISYAQKMAGPDVRDITIQEGNND